MFIVESLCAVLFVCLFCSVFCLFCFALSSLSIHCVKDLDIYSLFTNSVNVFAITYSFYIHCLKVFVIYLFYSHFFKVAVLIETPKTLEMNAFGKTIRSACFRQIVLLPTNKLTNRRLFNLETMKTKFYF